MYLLLFIGQAEYNETPGFTAFSGGKSGRYYQTSVPLPDNHPPWPRHEENNGCENTDRALVNRGYQLKNVVSSRFFVVYYSADSKKVVRPPNFYRGH